MKTRIYICALAALFMIPLAVTAQTKKKAKKEEEKLFQEVLSDFLG